MDLRILSVVQWGKQHTQDRKDGLNDLTKIVTQEPDYNRSLVYINRRQDHITIKHTNDLPKYCCKYPDQAKRVAHYFDKPDFDCYNSVYSCWYEAYRARGPQVNERTLRGFDPVDPEHLKGPSTSTKVLTKTWNQRYKQVDSTSPLHLCDALQFINVCWLSVCLYVNRLQT